MIKKKNKYQRADDRHPRMGLDNKICINPEYWCRLYQVWLSKEDVKRKKCMNKTSLDMMSTSRCGCLEKKEFSWRR